MTSPDSKTIDLAAVFTGQTYPEETFQVYLDHNAGYQVYKASQALRDAETAVRIDDSDANKKSAKRAEKAKDKAIKDVADKAFTVTVRAVPRAFTQDVHEQVTAKHPPKENILNPSQPTPDPKAEEAYTNELWALHIINFVDFEGNRVKFDTAEDARFFRRNAPDVAINTITDKIGELYAGERAGFETTIKEVDFLSVASPEA